jgi:hypothetical protein
MLCIGAVRIGPARQSFWAVWDRDARELHERTALGRAGVRMHYGHAEVHEGPLRIDLRLEETAGVETVSRSGESYGWTRKQGGIRVRGTLAIGGARKDVDARGVIDDTSAYYERHTAWLWSAGVGELRDGRAAAWNLVAGVNDADAASERTVWVDGEPREVGPATFEPGLGWVTFAGARSPGGAGGGPGGMGGMGGGGELRFTAEATRTANENKLLVRSRYRQPFGTFSGTLGEGLELAEAYGVMEEHDVYW